jgi:hypothetical protein
MPTEKPRLQVTLTPKQHDLLSRLSLLQKRSRAAVLLEVFQTIEPVLERVAAILEAAVRAQHDALDGLRTATESAQANVEPMMVQALGQLDLLVAAAGVDQAAPPGRADAAPEARGRPSRRDPPALTGGSGRRTTVYKHSTKRVQRSKGTARGSAATGFTKQVTKAPRMGRARR